MTRNELLALCAPTPVSTMRILAMSDGCTLKTVCETLRTQADAGLLKEYAIPGMWETTDEGRRVLDEERAREVGHG